MKNSKSKEDIEGLDAVEFLANNPEVYIEEILGVETLEQYHRDICRLVIEHDYLNIKACHAVGKTWIFGKLVPWFITTHPYSIVITTAPTNRQVEKLLWGEIRSTIKTSKTKLGGRLINKEWKIDEQWYAMGFSPANKSGEAVDGQQQGSSFQGFHAKYVLILFDEATGITSDMYTMAEGLITSGKVVKWVCIANPTSTSCQFYKNTKLATWYTYTINLFSSPNLIANGITDMISLTAELEYLRTLNDQERLLRIKNYKKPNDYLLSAQWAIGKLYTWGLDSPLSRSKILGEFPTSNDDVIITFENMTKANLRFDNGKDDDDYDKRYIALDVARFGDDLCVYSELRDNRLFRKKSWSKEELSDTEGRLTRLFWEGDDGKETHIGIDTTGLGAGIYSNLKEKKYNNELPENVFIHEIIFGSTDFDIGSIKENEEAKKYYSNIKSLMYFKLNEDLRDNLEIPDEEIYLTETCGIRYRYSKKDGKLLVESKEDYKIRTKTSPDSTDSLAMVNFLRYLKPSYATFKPRTSDKDKRFNQNRKAIGTRIKPRE